MSTTKNNKPTLTPAEALQMLASAISYLQAAGLTIKVGNHHQLGLVLAIDGAHVNTDTSGTACFESCAILKAD